MVEDWLKDVEIWTYDILSVIRRVVRLNGILAVLLFMTLRSWAMLLIVRHAHELWHTLVCIILFDGADLFCHQMSLWTF